MLALAGCGVRAPVIGPPATPPPLWPAAAQVAVATPAPVPSSPACPDGGCADAPAPPAVAVDDGALADAVARMQVEFRTGAHALDGAAQARLDQLAAMLTAHPELELVELGGHVDPPERRAGLDRLRAQAVRAYLVARGVDGDRLIARGYGATAARSGGAINRRVEPRVQLAVH
ncbi:MAG: OmpA family protein [Kofleriaceae bacterium]